MTNGFSTTPFEYRGFLNKGGTNDDEKLANEFLYTDDNKLMEVGRAIRDMIMDTPIWPDFEDEVRRHCVLVSGCSETFA